VESSGEADDRFGAAMASADFDADGISDLAVAAPGDGVGSVAGAGLVNVLYATTAGLSATGDQMWHQDSAGVLGVAEPGDRFGSALAAGDFDGDGFDDLAIGAPYEDVDGQTDAGAVNVLYGSKQGLDDAGDQMWHQNEAGVLGVSQQGDRFGAALSAADFNGDGFDDLAIGAPRNDIGSVANAGLVIVLYGSPQGLRAAGSDRWWQAGPDILGFIEPGDRFGAAVAAGDLDGDGFDDLVIGVPGESKDGKANAGHVHVIFGSAAGLSADGDQVWSQARKAVWGIAEPGDGFGAAVAASDLNGDGFDDLVVGVPNEGVHGAAGAGAVNVLYGGIGGPSAADDLLIKAGYDGFLATSEPGDRYGAELRAVDFNGDGFDDLVIGIPGEDLGSADAGAVHVVFGSASGVTSVGDQIWHQDSAGIEGSVEEGDELGYL
jgi:hypothetical protein